MSNLDLLSQRVILNGSPATVREVLDAYRQAHPTWRVSAEDAGEQVFVGNLLTSTGLWLDKILDDKTE